MPLADQAARSDRGGGSGLGAQVRDRGALRSGDLVARHCLSPADDGGRIGLGLGDDRRRFVPRVFEHRRSVLFGVGDLVRIFLAQRLCLGAQRLCLVKLLADLGDPLVEVAGDQRGHLLPQHHQDQHAHRERYPGTGTDDAERHRLDLVFGRAMSGSGEQRKQR